MLSFDLSSYRWRQNIWFALTCGSHPRVNPALSIFDRLSVFHVFLEDGHGSRPLKGLRPVLVLAVPTADQKAVVIVGIHLETRADFDHKLWPIEIRWVALIVNVLGQNVLNHEIYWINYWMFVSLLLCLSLLTQKGLHREVQRSLLFVSHNFICHKPYLKW